MTGFALPADITGRIWVLTGTDGRRTVTMAVTLRSAGGAVPVQQATLLEPPDLAPLTRVRPLEID